MSKNSRMPKKLSSTNAQTFFDTQKKKFLAEKDISEKKMFGTTALCINGKVFTFAWKGELVLKLPEERVAELIAAKKGKYFDPGHRRTSKTWIAMFPNSRDKWSSLIRLAKEFAPSK